MGDGTKRRYGFCIAVLAPLILFVLGLASLGDRGTVEVVIDNRLDRSLAVRFYEDRQAWSMPVGEKAFDALPSELSRPGESHRLRVYLNDFAESPLCETVLSPRWRPGMPVIVEGSASGCRIRFGRAAP